MVSGGLKQLGLAIGAFALGLNGAAYAHGDRANDGVEQRPAQIEVTDTSLAACEEKLVDLVALESILKDHSSSITNPFWISSFAPFQCDLGFTGNSTGTRVYGATRPDLKKLTTPSSDQEISMIVNRRDAQIIVSSDDPQKIVARRLRKISGVPVLFQANAPSIQAAHAFLDAAKRLNLRGLKIARAWKKHAGQFSRFDAFDEHPGFYRFSREGDPFVYGVISDDGQIVLDAGFEMILPTREGFIIRTEDLFWGMYAQNGDEILPPEYSTIKDEDGDRALVFHVDGTQQAFDVKARRFLSERYQGIEFVEGRNLVITRGDEGYRLLTRDMTPAFGDLFSRVMKLRTGRLIVGIEGKEGLVDESWNYLIDPQYERLWPHYKHGLLYARRGDASAYFDFDGKAITPAGWQAHYAPSDEKGHITVSDPEGQFGILRKDGSVLVEPKFSQAFQFREGYLPAAIKVEGGQRFGLIDEDGNTVIPFEYDVLQLVFNGRLWAKRDGKYGLIGVDQSVIADFALDAISRHRSKYDGESGERIPLMVARRDGQFGIIRHDTGETVVPFEYSDGRPMTLELRRGDEWLSYPCGFGIGGDSCKNTGVITTVPASRRPREQ